MISTQALERRVKRSHLREIQEYFAVGPPGLESVLEQELKGLKSVTEILGKERGGVAFRGELDAIYETNLHLSSANRVLLRVAEFPAMSFPALFNRCKRIAWELFVGFANGVDIRASSHSSSLYIKSRIVETVGSAIKERLAIHGLFPSIKARADTELQFFVRITNNRCTISLNTSGEHLHKRGWRTLTPKAPLRESIAAGLLLEIGVDRFDCLVDPFCGSGTFVIEAARKAIGHPPGADRSFAFEVTPFFRRARWERIRRLALEKVSRGTVQKLAGSDRDPVAVGLAQANAKAAGVGAMVSFSRHDALTLPYEKICVNSPNCLMVANLPYGRRLSSTKEVELVAQKFSTMLNEQCGGWTVGILCSSETVLSGLSLNDKKVKAIDNGGLRTEFVTGIVASGPSRH